MGAHFHIISLPNPDHDTGEILQSVEVGMAPLGYPFGRDKIDRCPNLRVIASSTLSVPHIDVGYACSKDIRVCWLSEDQRDFLETITPTAELCWSFIIAVTRRIPWAHKAVCEGNWDGRSFGSKTPRMLSNMTLGILGLGRLGSKVATYGKAFGMDVYYFSPRSENPDYHKCHSPLDLAKHSDIVSVHAHHTPETERMISDKFFSAMRPGSYFVNTARGVLVDESALLAALQSGHLAGAALDVLADEYTPSFRSSLTNHALVQYARTHDNLIITPHYAGATVDAWIMTQSRTIELVLQYIG